MLKTASSLEIAQSPEPVPIEEVAAHAGLERALRADRPRRAAAADGAPRHGLPDPVRARVRDAQRPARFAALPYKQPGDAADEEFPLILVTGLVLQHYNAGTMARRIGNLELVDRDVLEIHRDDAAALWIADGDNVSVRSRVGRIELHARVTDRIERGHVFTSLHFPEVRTNLLVGQSADVNTSWPEYKVVAVDVRPVSERPTRTPAIAAA